jgi:hypothetical protein
MRACWLVLCVVLGGCMFQNMGAGKRLADTVNQMDKSTRWGQLAQAAQLAVPAYREQFMAKHADWGRVIQVADSEVVHVEMAPDSQSAIALLSYEWYLPDAMTLHQSVVSQRWLRAGSAYVLISEAIVEGDPRLFRANGARGAAPVTGPTTVGLMN